MTTAQLYSELNNVNHSREKRLQYANLVLSTPSLTPKLLNILFMVNDKTSVRAAWILEFICRKDIDFIAPYLNVFTENIKNIHLGPAVRTVAKICELLAMAYTNKTNNAIKTLLTQVHKDRIIETCFDYMINNEKTAPKAYSMNTLFILGEEYKWVHPELFLILERDFKMQSSGFKARARHILNKINKNKT